MAMKEWLLWSNCNNNCEFCWQCKRPNPNTFLNNEDKITSIKKCIEDINSLNEYDDVLIVGGEAYASYSKSVNKVMYNLFTAIKNKMDSGNIRFFYVNTNLLYEDLTVIESLLEMFKDKIEFIKFTTSYDLYGRFKNDIMLHRWEQNVTYLKNKYPDLNIVTNIILTKQACDQIISGQFNVVQFWEKFNLKYVNLLPYITLPDNDVMSVKFSTIVHALEIVEKQHPGYLNFYYHDYNDNQDKILYEYTNEEKDFVECTAKYSECGHNVNFKKVTGDGSCYICNLFNYLEDRL